MVSSPPSAGQAVFRARLSRGLAGGQPLDGGNYATPVPPALDREPEPHPDQAGQLLARFDTELTADAVAITLIGPARLDEVALGQMSLDQDPVRALPQRVRAHRRDRG